MMSSNKGLFAKWVLPLRSGSRSNMREVGSKAANLGELLALDYPVPEGFVLKVRALDRFLAWNGLKDSSPREKLVEAPIPPDVERELLNAYEQLADSSLAVRSSGIAEDLPNASFAGKYETILDVQGLGAVMDAVKRCWASAFSSRVATYSKSQLPSSSASASNADVAPSRMAVLIQRLIPASSAGIAFTANPVNGDRNEVIINSVKGLTEKLVSGQSTPDQWIVRGNEASCVSSKDSSIDAKQALEIAELAKRVEVHFGAPQDIEWAISGGSLYLLQARPITSSVGMTEEKISPVPIAIEVPEGFWQRDEVFNPQPYLPMDRSISIPISNAVFRRIFSDFGLPLEGQEGREIGGWYYFGLVPPGGKDRSPPPNWLMPLLIRAVPQIRSRIKTCVEAIRSDKHGKYIELWYNESLPRAVSEASKLKNIQLGSLSDSELEKHLNLCLKFFKEGQDMHFDLIIPWILIVGEFVLTSRELLRWDDQKVLEMISGLSIRTTEPSRALSELAKLAEEKNNVREFILGSGSKSQRDLLEHLEGMDVEFSEAFNQYMNEFGFRTLRYVFSEPTLSEKPELIVDLVRDQVIRSYDPLSSATALEERRRSLIQEAKAQLKGDSLVKFERLLSRAERAYPTRGCAKMLYLTNALIIA